MQGNKQDIIKTWHWRIERVGHSQVSFAKLLEINHASLSHYKSGRQIPRDGQFAEIEKKLVELEQEKGFA